MAASSSTSLAEDRTPEGYQTVPDHTNKGWPPGVPYIVGNEACERFSYYGMRAILQVHLTSLFVLQFALDDSRRFATQTVHLFMAGVYALPMIGALIADRWAGKYRTILYLSLVYCAGHAVLSAFENHVWGMYLGLALIAVGSGGIKPCVSANVGDQFGKANQHLVRTIYQIFYFSINFGSFFATLLIPYLRSYSGALVLGWFPGLAEGVTDEAELKQLSLRIGTSIAFGLPGVLMFLATFIFWLGRHKFVHVPPKPGGSIGLLDTACSVSLFLAVGHLFVTPELVEHSIHDALLRNLVLGAVSLSFLGLGLYLFAVRQKIAPDDGFLAIMFHVLKSHLGMATPGTTSSPQTTPLARHWFWRPGVERFGEHATEGPVAVLKIVSIFFLVSVFWALFDQHSSTWITQAGEMDLWLWGQGNGAFLGIPNVKLEASQVPAMNPVLVMLLIPVMNLVYRLVDRLGIETTPLRRMTIGMYLTAASFAATAILQAYIDAAPKGSIWFGWQIVQYVIITIAEVMVSITGLEFAYTQAPKKMKSTVMGFWLLSVTLGNVLVAFLAGFKGLKPVDFFWAFTWLSVGAAVIFGLRAFFYTPRDFTQE
ncbi:MAG: hypothetical protein U0840_13745 [Gemmataceae bacterium]